MEGCLIRTLELVQWRFTESKERHFTPLTLWGISQYHSWPVSLTSNIQSIITTICQGMSPQVELQCHCTGASGVHSEIDRTGKRGRGLDQTFGRSFKNFEYHLLSKKNVCTICYMCVWMFYLQVYVEGWKILIYKFYLWIQQFILLWPGVPYVRVMKPLRDLDGFHGGPDEVLNIRTFKIMHELVGTSEPCF